MLYTPKKYEGLDTASFLKVLEENDATLEKIDKEAKEKGKLLYRYLSEPYADGYAIYQIIRVNKTTVRIRVCTGIGDDLILPYWGEEATIDKTYAETKIRQRDTKNKMFMRT